MTRSFRRSIDELEEIETFISEYIAESGINEDHAFDVNLIIEELFTNFVKYNNGVHDISIGLDRAGDKLTISLTDFDVEPYDVTQRPEVDTSRPAAERRPGGLGIHFIKKIAESISFEHTNGNSTTTVIVGLRG